MFAKVSPQSEKTQGTSFYLKLHAENFQMFKKFDSFTVSWHFQIIFASESHILFALSDKNQKLCKSAQTSSKDPGYRWYFKKWYPGSNLVIYFCLPIQKSGTLPQGTGEDGVRNYAIFHTKIKMSAKVSQQSKKTQPISFHVQLHS